MKNQLKTIGLLGLLSGLLLLVGWFVGGVRGLTIGLIFALLFNFTSYWFSDKIVLGLYRATPAGETHAYLNDFAQELAEKANMPKPRVYVVNSPHSNAFATGRSPKHGVVVFTTGILSILDKDEIRAVMGHEMAHIKSRDTLISTVAAGIAAVISYVAFMARWAALFGGVGNRDNQGRGLIEILVLGFLTPLVATIIQLAISRSREFVADKKGAEFTRTPLKLASALEKISRNVAKQPLQLGATTTSTAHMFIANPFRGRAILNLLSTHPPVEKRVRKLEEMHI